MQFNLILSVLYCCVSSAHNPPLYRSFNSVHNRLTASLMHYYNYTATLVMMHQGELHKYNTRNYIFGKQYNDTKTDSNTSLSMLGKVTYT